MLFSDEQKLLLKGGKKGFVKNTKLDFTSLKNESTLRLISVGSSMENSRSSLGNPRELTCSVCPILNTYVGMLSPASGPAVLC
jgi:hypothetical protein